jgi:uncharacterized membrane protein
MAFLALVLLAALVVRVPFLLSGVYGGDAAYHARAAVTLLNGGLLYRDVPYTYPPLYAYTEAAAIATFGNTDLGWKATALIYDFGCAILVYLLASRLYGRNKGVLAAGVYGLSPLPVLGTGLFICFDSTAAFWMLLSLLLLADKKAVPSAVAMGVGAAYKYFPLILLPAAIVYVQSKRQRIVYALASLATFAVFQLPFLLIDFPAWLDNVFLYHITRPASGATLYNLLRVPPQFFDVQTPLTLLSPITLLLAFALVAIRGDKSEAGLIRNAAFLMVTAVFFNKVVLFYALWFLPLICMWMVALRRRRAVLVLIQVFILQAALLIGWFASEASNFQAAFFMAYVYLAVSGTVVVWLLSDRLRII